MQDNWLDFVKEEFAARRAEDPRFSLRSFARLIGVAPSTLSCILTGQRRITPQIALKFVENCQFSTEKKNAFLHLAVGQGVSDIAAERTDKDFRVLSDDELEKIAHWQHYAILSLAQIPDCRSEPSWIAQRLNISEDAAEAALRDLIDFGFIEIRGHTFKRRTRSVRSRSDIPHEHVRGFHAELMHKGLNSLSADPVTHRDITAVTMPVNSRRLKIAKRKIKEFRRYLMDFLSHGPKDSIYAMQVSLFPLAPSPDGRK